MTANKQLVEMTFVRPRRLPRPGAVATELAEQNSDTVQADLTASAAEAIPAPLQPADIAEAIVFMVTR